MPLLIGILVLLLVAVFSAIFGVLLAASIGIRRNDRGDYRALRSGTDDRTFSGAGRRLSGLRFPGGDPDLPAEDDDPETTSTHPTSGTDEADPTSGRRLTV